MSQQSDGAEREVVSTRVFDAPLAKVVTAFTDPEQLKMWWGPTAFSNTFHEFDPTPGGRWRYVMHGPDGTDYHNECEFVEVAANRIVFDHLEPVHRFRMTMTFAEADGKTTLTWRLTFDSAAEFERVKPFVTAGNEQNHDRLAAHLAAEAADREIVIVRDLAAPPAVVWKVWTDPVGLSRWWGPNGFTTTTHAMDFRVGGEWRFTMHGPDGKDYPNLIAYRVLTPHERMEYDHSDPSGEVPPFRAAVTFAGARAGTRLTLRLVCGSAAERENFVKFGAVEGGRQTLERLAAELATHS